MEKFDHRVQLVQDKEAHEGDVHVQTHYDPRRELGFQIIVMTCSDREEKRKSCDEIHRQHQHLWPAGVAPQPDPAWSASRHSTEVERLGWGHSKVGVVAYQRKVLRERAGNHRDYGVKRDHPDRNPVHQLNII